MKPENDLLPATVRCFALFLLASPRFLTKARALSLLDAVPAKLREVSSLFCA